jgi:hypothetical protein
MEQGDNELWRRAAAGEPEAFGLLYERHARAMYLGRDEPSAPRTDGPQ